tara:strand:- start:2033 stop:2641 length:609 start_codon:yes stop_codon:yes gene_type:complete
MTTPYAVSRNIGSSSYGGYLNAPITGPLSTSQSPLQIPYHSYGMLKGLRPTPPQFYSMQEPVYADMNTNAKHHYLRATISNQQAQQQIALGKTTSPISHVIQSSQRRVPTSAHTNYIAPIQSSMHINTLKANAVGKTAYKVNLPNSAPISSKSYYPSGTKSAIRRVRSGGCVAPKKKGAIENRSLTNGGSGAGWGAITRQNY